VGEPNVTVNLVGTSHELREVREDRLWGRYSYGKYPANTGIERMLDLFERTGIKATFFVPALEAVKAPDLVRRVTAAGHEIAAHGNAMEDHSQLGDAEAELLANAHEKLLEIAGVAPRGWRAPGGTMSANTLRHLAALGYAYDSSFEDDDLPYSLKADGGGTMVELPQNEMLIDATLWKCVRPTSES
jgi:peptidoglycan/xylan/chitin deacetylase (PgdA/CDA1 family)